MRKTIEAKISKLDGRINVLQGERKTLVELLSVYDKQQEEKPAFLKNKAT